MTKVGADKPYRQGQKNQSVIKENQRSLTIKKKRSRDDVNPFSIALRRRSQSAAGNNDGGGRCRRCVWLVDATGQLHRGVPRLLALVVLLTLWLRWQRERFIRKAPLLQFLKRKLRDTYPALSPKHAQRVEGGLRKLFLACHRSRPTLVAMPSKSVDATNLSCTRGPTHHDMRWDWDLFCTTPWPKRWAAMPIGMMACAAPGSGLTATKPSTHAIRCRWPCPVHWMPNGALKAASPTCPTAATRTANQTRTVMAAAIAVAVFPTGSASPDGDGGGGDYGLAPYLTLIN